MDNIRFLEQSFGKRVFFCFSTFFIYNDIYISTFDTHQMTVLGNVCKHSLLIFSKLKLGKILGGCGF